MRYGSRCVSSRGFTTYSASASFATRGETRARMAQNQIYSPINLPFASSFCRYHFFALFYHLLSFFHLRITSMEEKSILRKCLRTNKMQVASFLRLKLFIKYGYTCKKMFFFLFFLKILFNFIE